MDWSTVALSALVSAVVSAAFGAVSSLVTASTITVRQARAQRNEEARLRLADAVRPLRQDLAQYRAKVGTAPNRERDASEQQDYVIVGGILRASGGLRRSRRRRVERRCRKVFGNYWTDLAIVYPVSEGATAGEIFAPVLMAGFKKKRTGADDESRHLLHLAYSEPPAHHLQRDLARQLGRVC